LTLIKQTRLRSAFYFFIDGILINDSHRFIMRLSKEIKTKLKAVEFLRGRRRRIRKLKIAQWLFAKMEIGF